MMAQRTASSKYLIFPKHIRPPNYYRAEPRIIPSVPASSCEPERACPGNIRTACSLCSLTEPKFKIIVRLSVRQVAKHFSTAGMITGVCFSLQFVLGSLAQLRSTCQALHEVVMTSRKSFTCLRVLPQRSAALALGGKMPNKQAILQHQQARPCQLH